jgi:hypothetical protein
MYYRKSGKTECSGPRPHCFHWDEQSQLFQTYYPVLIISCKLERRSKTQFVTVPSISRIRMISKTAMTTTMTMSDIKVASPYGNDIASHVRIGSKRLEGDEDAMKDSHIVVITENDVLLGRGGKKNQHIGNEKLRLMATKYSFFYRAALKREKPVIALLLVHLVQTTKPSGR